MEGARMSDDRLSRADLVALVAQELDIDSQLLERESFAVLGVDSLQILEIDLLLEELGVLIEEDEFELLRSVDDVFTVYEKGLA
jgi:acyl carrier protein